MASTANYLSDEAHRCIDEIEGSLRDRAKAGRWVVEGEATSGKSAVLRQLQSRLRQSQRPVVHLAPPSRSLDSGPCAMLSLAGQLYDAQPEGKDLEALLRQKTLDGYFNVVSDWLPGFQGELVLLLDEPDAWSSAEAGKDQAFLEQTQRVLTFLGHIDCSQVLTGRTPAQFPWQPQQRRRLRLAGRNRQFLSDPDAWGELSDSAAKILLRDSPFDSYSPLEIRLLVGVESVDPRRVAELLEPGTDRTTLTNTLREVISKSPEHRGLLACWNLLSRCRGPISESMLSRLEARFQIQGPTLALLRHCLLYQEPGPRWVLHGSFQSGNWGSEPLECHSWLAREYLLEAKSGTQTAILQADAEAYHHAVQSGDSQLWDSCRCFFVEQLNLWGRRLSKGAQDYEGATRIFERALLWDDEDPYANHYLAYNLDVQAREPERVERHYRKAVLLQPEHPWLHSRLVNFLLAFARNREAREAWDKTQELSAFHSTGPIYRELHFWVLRMLLHRGQLDFAKDVLGCIPSAMLTQFPELKQLRDQYESQYLAQTHGALVPGPVLTNGWWSRGPFRLRTQLSSGHQLRTWCAARVEAVGVRSIELKMASIELRQASAPDVHWAEVEKETLADWRLLDVEELEAGSFLEIGYYYRAASAAENEQVRAYLHQPDTHPMLDLPRLQPNPDRYLRRALR